MRSFISSLKTDETICDACWLVYRRVNGDDEQVISADLEVSISIFLSLDTFSFIEERINLIPLILQ